jgi:hypothetical protein
MFKKNENYKQQMLFDVTCSLSTTQRNMLESSIEHIFFSNIFCKINEKEFEVLYSTNKSRPNVPVNQMVGALILKHLKNWTYEELFKNLNFNILTRHALGVNEVGGSIFSEASIYNFQNRVIGHYVKTGKDLLTEVFDSLTADQLKEFGVNTSIQRGDSFLLGSNIFDYTRLQLLIEVLLRLFKHLNEEDKKKFSNLLINYTKQTAGQYIYKIEKENLPKEINQLASIYHELYSSLSSEYFDTQIFSIFKRVYQEHFVVVNNKIEVIANNNLNSSILMSPDDTTATFRPKYGGSKGYSGHLSETAHPENKINLITDIAVVPNNTDDSVILADRLPIMLEKTDDLTEYFVDGSYGGPKVDEIVKESAVTIVQTAVRGKKTAAKLRVEIDNNDGEIYVSCSQGQRVKAEISTTRNGNFIGKANFNSTICAKCPHRDVCRTKNKHGKKNKDKRLWVFTEARMIAHQRIQNIYKIPEERRKIRANVEATIKEVKRGLKNGKSRVRGLVRNMFYLTLTSIAVNLTRIHKNIIDEGFFVYFLGQFLALEKNVMSNIHKIKNLSCLFLQKETNAC